jgi:hypothetical protein
MGKGRDKRKRKAKAAKIRLPPRPEPLRDPPPSFGDPDALILARLRPKPYRGSGAIALPEPHEAEELEERFVAFVRGL